MSGVPMEPRRSSPAVAVARHSPHLTAVAVWTLWAVAVVFAALSVGVAWSGGSGILPIVLNLAALTFATSGAILVSRLPSNVIGWLLAAGGLCFALGNGASSLAAAGSNADPGSVPDAIWFAWLSEWIWAPAVGAIVGLLLVYPTGRLLSRRWRPVSVTATILIALFSIGGAFGPWSDGQYPAENPLLITGGLAPTSVLGLVVGPLALAVASLAAASIVIRYRRSVGVERQQLKWFAFVAGVCVPAFLVTTILYGATGTAAVVGDAAGLVAYGGFALLPIAIGVAVLRHRLYEIDRLISRTISWAAVTLFVIAAYAAAILLLQTALTQWTAGNTVAVAASTLGVGALFQPLRRRIQTRVDRRFNRARYDAERTIAGFVGRLRDEVDLDQLGTEISAMVTLTVQPTSVVLWLRLER